MYHFSLAYNGNDTIELIHVSIHQIISLDLRLINVT